MSVPARKGAAGRRQTAAAAIKSEQEWAEF